MSNRNKNRNGAADADAVAVDASADANPADANPADAVKEPTIADAAAAIAAAAREAIEAGGNGIDAAEACAMSRGRKTALIDADKRKLKIPLRDGRVLETKGASPALSIDIDGLVAASFTAKSATFTASVEKHDVIGADGKAKRATESIPSSVFDAAVATAASSESVMYNRVESVVLSVLEHNPKLAAGILAALKKK